MSDSYPEFEDAIRRFQTFAQSKGVPRELVFVSSRDVVLRGNSILLHLPDQRRARSNAETSYRQAVERDIGVCISALCEFDGHTCVYVGSPANEQEAESLMFSKSLKLSIPEQIRTATVIGRILWMSLRLIESSESRRMKEYLFK